MYSQPPAQRTPQGLVATEVAGAGSADTAGDGGDGAPRTEAGGGTPAPARAVPADPARPAAASARPASAAHASVATRLLAIAGTCCGQDKASRQEPEAS
jgi:hypothetical protein